jgi:hypothetical protein
LCKNIIELKDRYFKTLDEADPKKYGQVIRKEYLFIVTDYLPFTICDLKVNEGPQQQNLESIRQVMFGLF